MVSDCPIIGRGARNRRYSHLARIGERICRNAGERGRQVNLPQAALGKGEGTNPFDPLRQHDLVQGEVAVEGFRLDLLHRRRQRENLCLRGAAEQHEKRQQERQPACAKCHSVVLLG